MMFFLRNMRNLALVMGPVMLFVFVYSHYFQNKPRDELAFVGAGDPQMAAARAQGKATLPVFLQHLRSPAPDEDHFLIKFRLDRKQIVGRSRFDPPAGPDEEPDEFIWAKNPSLAGRGDAAFVAFIDDTPRAKGFYSGQPVVVPVEDVVDWGYSKGGVMQGNFTTKVLLAKLSPREAARAKQAMGWRD